MEELENTQAGLAREKDASAWAMATLTESQQTVVAELCQTIEALRTENHVFTMLDA